MWDWMAMVSTALAGQRARPDGAIAAACVLLLAMVPLALTPVYPLTDYYAHIARYHILASLGTGSPFEENYASNWRLLPNLGLELVGVGLMKIMSPLACGRVMVALIFANLYLAVLAVARQLGGRITPLNAVLAGFLLYSNILLWGFSNFLFGLGLAFWGAALWLWLRPWPMLQLAASGLFSVLLLIAHGLSFAFYGVFLAALEVGILFHEGRFTVTRAVTRLARLATLAIVPFLMFLSMPTAQQEQGVTGSLSNLWKHAEAGRLFERLLLDAQERTDSILRVSETPYRWLDYGLNGALWLALLVLLWRRTLVLDTRLWPAFLGFAALTIILPPSLFGTGYLDDRVPLVIVAILAMGLTVTRLKRAPLIVGTLAAVLALKIAVTAAYWAESGRTYTRFLQDARAIPEEALVNVLLADTGYFHRSFRPSCAPLLFLTAMQEGAGVPMFAYEHQQPFRITGPLKEAQDAVRMTRPPDFRFHEVGGFFEKVLGVFADSSFEYIVVCGADRLSSIPDSLERVAAHGPYTIYRTATGRD